MDEIKRLTPAQRARCNRLIRRLCANYAGGNCLPLDDGEDCVCVQMISYSLLCKYFRRAVLPADKELYDDISSIKRIADGFNIAILLVHHLRKLQDSDDHFNDVSGSTGIIGAADTNFILRRKRSGNAATLLVSGRDVEYQELTLQFNDLVWELVERRNSEDIHKAELPKFLFRVVDFMECRTEWVGTATELLTEMKEREVTPNMVTKYLGQFAYEVLEPLGIEYRTKRTGKSRLIKFLRRDGDDANDAGIAI